MRRLLFLSLSLILLGCSGGGGGGSDPVALATVPEEAPAPVPTRPPEPWLSWSIDFYKASTPRLIERLKAGESQVIMFTGSSLSDPLDSFWVQALLDKLEADYPGLVTAYNVARLCSTTREVIGQAQLASAYHPDVVFIEGLVNDAYEPYGLSIQNTLSDLAVIVAEIRAGNPDCEIIVMTTNPTDSRDIDRPHLADYYQAGRYFAWEHGLFLCDLNRAWLAELTTDKTTLQWGTRDGCHPNREGTDRVIIPAILEYLGGEA